MGGHDLCGLMTPGPECPYCEKDDDMTDDYDKLPCSVSKEGLDAALKMTQSRECFRATTTALVTAFNEAAQVILKDTAACGFDNDGGRIVVGALNLAIAAAMQNFLMQVTALRMHVADENDETAVRNACRVLEGILSGVAEEARVVTESEGDTNADFRAELCDHYGRLCAAVHEDLHRIKDHMRPVAGADEEEG